MLTMMISFKISKLVWLSWKTNSIIHQKQQFPPTHLDIHKLHWQFWLIWVSKDSLLNVQMSIFYFRTKHNSFGKLNPPMVNIMELYQPISDGPFMVSKINSLVQDQDKIYVQQKKTTSTTWGEKTSFWKEFFTVLILWDILDMISNNLMSILIKLLRQSCKSSLLKDVIK